GKWQPPDRFKAIRLLGRQPLEIWDDERVLSIYLACVPMDPEGAHPFGDLSNELTRNQGKRLAQRINERKACQPPIDAEDGRKMLRRIIAKEEERLEALLGQHLERQPESAMVSEFDASAEGERLRRYQATCDRALLRVLEALRKRKKDAEGPGRK